MDEPSILQQFTLEVEIHSGIYRCYAIVSAVELRSVGGCQTDGQSGKSIYFPDRGNTYSISSVVGGACNPGIIACQPLHKECLRLQQKAAQLQKENNAARYTALQNQLNPHFLFNSLNTLIAEIEYNPSNAVRFTRNLSDVYRYVLQSQDKTLITLGEELEFIQSYLFLHEVRLGNCIACNITIPTEAMEYQLPPLTLQLLVENVIKHNSINSNKPMDITIQIADHFLVVSNPIHAKKNDTTSGVGLQNLSNRCKLMIGTDIIINNENQIFTVKVPLIYE